MLAVIDCLQLLPTRKFHDLNENAQLCLTFWNGELVQALPMGHWLHHICEWMRAAARVSFLEARLGDDEFGWPGLWRRTRTHLTNTESREKGGKEAIKWNCFLEFSWSGSFQNQECMYWGGWCITKPEDLDAGRRKCTTTHYSAAPSHVCTHTHTHTKRMFIKIQIRVYQMNQFIHVF